MPSYVAFTILFVIAIGLTSCFLLVKIRDQNPLLQLISRTN